MAWILKPTYATSSLASPSMRSIASANCCHGWLLISLRSTPSESSTGYCSSRTAITERLRPFNVVATNDDTCCRRNILTYARLHSYVDPVIEPLHGHAVSRDRDGSTRVLDM